MPRTTDLCFRTDCEPYRLKGFHRLRYAASRVELWNDAVWGDGVTCLRTFGVFSRGTHRLVDYQSSFQRRGVPVELTRLRMTRGGMMAFHRVGRHVWSEMWPEADPRGVPWLPFAYAELVYLLRCLDWRSRENQFFPMLPLVGDRDKLLHRFRYAFQVSSGEQGVGHILAADLYEGPFGAMGNPARIDVVVDKKVMFREDAYRGNFIVHGVPLSSAEAGKAFLSSSRRVYAGSGRFPPKTVPTRTTSITAPFPLSLAVPQKRPRFFSGTIVFSDLFSLWHRESLGARRLRTEVSRRFSEGGVSVYVYEDLITYINFVEGIRLPSFSDLRAAVRKIWSKLPARARNGCTLLCYGADCFCIPFIFKNAPNPPPLVLLLPPRFSDGLGSEESELLRKGGYPDPVLPAIVGEYGGPVLILGEEKLLGSLRAVPVAANRARAFCSLRWQSHDNELSETRLFNVAVVPLAVREVLRWSKGI